MIWMIFWLAAESTVLSSFPSTNVRLDMAFLSVAAVGFLFEFANGLFFVLLAGVFTDAVSGAPFGTFTAVYTAAFSLIRFATSSIYVHSVVSRFIWITIVSAFALWTKALLLALILKNANSFIFTLWNFIPQSIFNGVIGIFVVPFFNWYITLSWQKLFKPKGLVIK